MDFEKAKLKLRDQERYVLDVLRSRDSTGLLASMYIGTIEVVTQEDNPERLVHSSHSARELMEKLPFYLNFPVETHTTTLKERAQALAEKWTKLKKQKFYKQPVKKWPDKIDNNLRSFLTTFEEFFEWMGEHRPSRAAQAQTVVRNSDAHGMHMPDAVAKRLTRQWMELRRFFDNASHHRLPLTEDTLMAKRRELETMILDSLRPQAVPALDKLDRIIKDAESDANT